MYDFCWFFSYDIDSNSPDLRKHDFLGKIECSLGEIVAAGKFKRPLKGPKTNSGHIISKFITIFFRHLIQLCFFVKLHLCSLVTAEELTACKEEVCMQFQARKLDKKDFFGKSDPYLAIYKVQEDGTYTVCHRTEVKQ